MVCKVVAAAQPRPRTNPPVADLADDAHAAEAAGAGADDSGDHKPVR